MFKKAHILSLLILGIFPTASLRAEVFQPMRGCYFREKKSGNILNDAKCKVDLSSQYILRDSSARTAIPKNLTILWSDGVKTSINITSIEAMGNVGRYYKGEAIIDGEPALLTVFNDGGYGFEVKATGNRISFR
ncbi:MAG: hypothetical protein WBG73_12910 [Coleofasciculaceae cyanobacterium]